jgi:hypothetical protein
MRIPFYKPVLLLLFVCLATMELHAQSSADSDIPEGGTKNFSGLGELGKKETEAGKKEPEKYYASRFLNFVLDEMTGTKTAVGQDTIPLGFQNMTFPERNTTVAGSYLANLGSPFQSKIFIDQKSKSDFLFGQAYDYWITAPNEQVFFNTTTPYTNIRYLTTSGNDYSQEENFKFLFTVNLNKYLNIGFDYEILYARGFYDHNSNRDKLGNVFGNYRNPRYEAYWTYSSNYIENMENGGITDDRYITQPLLMSGGLKEYESLNIPVALTDAKNIYRSTRFFLHHQYHAGFERVVITAKDSTAKSKKDIKDNKDNKASFDTIRTFVPVTSFAHTLLIEKYQKNYQSESADTSFYNKKTYLNTEQTSDTSSLYRVRNLFGITLEEGFNRWAQLGVKAFIEHDFRRYTHYKLLQGASGDTALIHHNKNLIWIGAELFRKTGKTLNFDAVGKICMAGEDLGDFDLNGRLGTDFDLWRKPVHLDVEGGISNYHPDYFLENYNSNHFVWSNHFDNQVKTYIRGNLKISSLGFNATASVDNLTNYIYFNKEAVPDQYSGNIQVLTLKLKECLKWGILHFDNDVVWQLSSRPEIIPLPDISTYSDLYLKFMISKVMTSHLGVDCRYHTSYYAPAYMPALSQFYLQDQVLVGNYPFMNLYANFHLKRMRFFAMYSHASRLFASPNYFSSPHYPLNPTILKVGLSWNFYD